MNVKKIFRQAAIKLLADFEISAEINHQGSKGTFREGALQKFLTNGRLPQKYGLGAGEIVGRISNVSKQVDLVIFDQFASVPLLYDENVQVYPIDGIYGTIEVKSTLSNVELIKGLNNIKSVKELCPEEFVSKRVGNAKIGFHRQQPFGIVFAYSLGNNSLETLTNNLIEWEKENSFEVWPNLIVVLNEGLIYHTKTFVEARIFPTDLDNECKPMWMAYKKDTFFYFYSYLLDLCNNIELPNIEISKYINMPERVGKYVLQNHDKIVRTFADGSKKAYKLTETFIDKMVNWCEENGKLTHEQFLMEDLGQIPVHLTKSNLNMLVYRYNPDNLLPMREVINEIVLNGVDPPSIPDNAFISSYVIVDGTPYYYTMKSLEEGDTEIDIDKTIDDL